MSSSATLAQRPPGDDRFPNLCITKNEGHGDHEEGIFLKKLRDPSCPSRLREVQAAIKGDTDSKDALGGVPSWHSWI